MDERIKLLKKVHMDLMNVDSNLRLLCIFYNSNCDKCKYALAKNGSGCIRREVLDMADNIQKELNNEKDK